MQIKTTIHEDNISVHVFMLSSISSITLFIGCLLPLLIFTLGRVISIFYFSNEGNEIIFKKEKMPFFF